MGPPRVIGGYTLHPSCGEGKPGRFNGAAESNRRIRGRPTHAIDDERALQWGRRE